MPTPSNTPAAIALPSERIPFADSTGFVSADIIAALALDTPISASIDDTRPAVLFTFNGGTNDAISVRMTAQDELDPFILVLDSKGREVARSDPNALEGTTAAIRGLILPETSTYIVVATRFGQQFGTSSGNFEIVFGKSPDNLPPSGIFSQPINYDALQPGTITDDARAQTYTFRGDAGDTISVQMSATGGNLDSRMFLTDNFGTTLDSNDDDLLNLTLDSYILEYILPRDGYYTILATRFEPRDETATTGTYRLKLTLDAPASDTLHPLYAVINLSNSTTLRDDGRLYANYSAGDAMQDGRELSLQTLLTFYLPPLGSEATLGTATLSLQPCASFNTGFDTLNELSIYLDTYGVLSARRGFTRLFAGARLLSTQPSCDPIDVTDLVRAAYQAGESQIQFRLTFRTPDANNEGDEVRFTPRLLLTRES
jgi:hypothetical protein